MPSLPVLSADGKSGDTLELAAEVFGAPPSGPVLHQGVVRELAARRAGTHDTKGRSEVSGGGRKPWRQKGTGRARQGSIRATQWKGGGKPFGPTPRDYDKRMPTGMRREALRSAFAGKIAAGELTVVERLQVAEPRTRVLLDRLKSLGVTGASVLLVMAERAEMVERAARNVPWLEVETGPHASAYQVVRADRVIIERAALLAVQEALTK
jgi:large subunit ribosomal protein L4